MKPGLKTDKHGLKILIKMTNSKSTQDILAMTTTNGLMNLPGIGQVCHHSSGLPSYVTDKTHSSSSVIFSDTSGSMAGNNTFFRKSTLIMINVCKRYVLKNAMTHLTSSYTS